MPLLFRPALTAFLHKAGLIGGAAVATGTAGAFFLWSLDAVTRLRFAHPWLLWWLPAIGLGMGWLYLKAGPRAERGTGLILDEIQQAGGGVPARMAPLILLGTLATHLGGGSAGREGTAVQIGGSLAGSIGLWGKAPQHHFPGLLMAGVAAGFGAVFGTPWAGAVFALEVLRHRTGRWKEWPWCLAAAWLADRVCHAWGGHHAAWQVGGTFPLTDFGAWGKVGLAAVCFGLLARGFVMTTHGMQGLMKRYVPWSPLRPMLGGLAVIGLVWVSGTRDYLGLGTLAATPGSMVLGSFFEDGVVLDPAAWAWKSGFTVMTVGGGFKGGEVTPLFFMGAALGYTLSGLLGLPAAWLAALGMTAVFGAAARTPAACFLMGMELFGPGLALPMAAACGVASLCNGRGLYHPAPLATPGP